MRFKKRHQGNIFFVPGILMLLHISLYSALNPSRVDFFDKSNNHLMFMTFNYNEAGEYIGRTVYMSDSTFIREVSIATDEAGNRIETSYDFNSDISFVTRMQSDGAQTSFTINDQFQLDHVGGAVRYSKTNPLNYDLMYADNSFASRMSYIVDEAGTLEQVNFTDEYGALQYYGTFLATGLKKDAPRNAKGAPPVIKATGRNGIELHLNLKMKSNVKCVLMTLDGRVAGVLFDREASKGIFHHQIKTVHQKAVSTGVYLLMVYVNGKVIASSKYLARTAAGGIQ